jgi:nucleotide-binding universal stress UspA family protein
MDQIPQPISIRRILYPTDFSELSLHALGFARSFCECFSATMHVLHVVDEAYLHWMAVAPNAVPVGPAPDDLLNQAKGQMEDFLRAHLADPPFEVISEVHMGRPFMEIIRYAREKTCDLIVIGTHGRTGLSHVLMGSTVEKVIRKAPCPVLSVRKPGQKFEMP